MIRVLALAPDVAGLPRLASSEELARLGDVPGVELRSLLDVTRQRIIDRLSREPTDVLVVIGHGLPGYVVVRSESGVARSETGHSGGVGERIEPQWLAEQLSNYGVHLAVIATCWSSQRPDSGGALSFSDVLPAAGIDCVTMDTEVGDRAALEYDVAMLQSLASGSTLRRAHVAGVAAAAVHGGGRQPRLTPRDSDVAAVAGATDAAQPGRPAASGTVRMDEGGVTDYRLRNSEQFLRMMDGKMDKLAEQMNDLTLQQRLLEERVGGLSRKVDGLETAVSSMRAPDGYSRAWLAGGAAMLAIMLVLLVLVTWRLL